MKRVLAHAMSVLVLVQGIAIAFLYVQLNQLRMHYESGRGLSSASVVAKGNLLAKESRSENHGGRGPRGDEAAVPEGIGDVRQIARGDEKRKAIERWGAAKMGADRVIREANPETTSKSDPSPEQRDLQGTVMIQRSAWPGIERRQTGSLSSDETDVEHRGREVYELLKAREGAKEASPERVEEKDAIQSEEYPALLAGGIPQEKARAIAGWFPHWEVILKQIESSPPAGELVYIRDFHRSVQERWIGTIGTGFNNWFKSKYPRLWGSEDFYQELEQ